jgi:serine/threonine protein kinase
MTPQRFQQVRNLFEAALERGDQERGAFVSAACENDPSLQQEVARLLEAHDSTRTIGGTPAARTDTESREGRRVGEYEIMRELGRGGMGKVYLARRADAAFQKSVAIKILRPDAASPEVLSRFHREREILAGLDHPNIARLLDAGETEEGLPYFVMEYVEGRTITDYADENRLTTRERIGLFEQVCSAVEYAHQRKIVHRDLKPGNILVDATGKVKLLDFGIARIVEDTGTAGLTKTGLWLMTPEYASPEQVRGEAAGRASDVYSLGVILFELLSGRRPYDLRERVFHEIVRVVCEERPALPSTAILQPIETKSPDTAGRLRKTTLDELKRELSGDLDNIVLRALQKSPEDRYASALQFQADIARHLSGETVWARGDSSGYRLGRFISRHRTEIVVSAVVVAAIASGAVSLHWSALWWLAASAVLAFGWRAATDPKIGRRIAESPLSRVGLNALLLSSLVGSTAVWIAQETHVWRSQAVGAALVMGLLNGAFAAASLLLLLSWLLRGRWTGPLLLKLTSSQQEKTLYVTCVVGVQNVVRYVWDHYFEKGRHQVPIALALGGIAVSAFYFLGTRPEIRREGFLQLGRLIRWSRIASWSWEDRPLPGLISVLGPKLEYVLVLQLHHKVRFMPPARIRVGSQKEEVDAILTRQLGAWPGAES